jgi:hypothetical protein
MTREELSEKIKDHLKKWIEGGKEFTLESEGENRINISFKLKGGTVGTIDLDTAYYWLNFRFFMDDTISQVEELDWFMEPKSLEDFHWFSDTLPSIEFTAWGEGKELGKMETIDDKLIEEKDMFKEYLEVFKWVDASF